MRSPLRPLQTKQAQLLQVLLVREMFQTPDHPCGPPQQLLVSFMLQRPKLDTGHSVSSSRVMGVERPLPHTPEPVRSKCWTQRRQGTGKRIPSGAAHATQTRAFP